MPNIQRTADLVQEISSATREQNVGADQINQAIRELDKVIQQNALAADESASTSEELASQSDQLRSVIGYFDLGESALGRKTSPVTRTPATPTMRSIPKSIHTPPPSKSGHHANGNGNGAGVDIDLLDEPNDADFVRY